jgi:transposase
MEIKLTPEDKRALELEHRYNHDRRVCDRIKAVLLKSEGWTNRQISQALRIHEETVRTHLTDWEKDAKLKPENGGSWSKLSIHESASLEAHLESVVYTRVSEICAYVEKSLGKIYTVSGMTKWLKEHRFSYKQPKAVPAKANVEAQEAFIKEYLKLLEETPALEPIVFMDSAHPTMATKIVSGWIRRGKDKPIEQTASRTRVNVTGAIDLSTMKVVSYLPEKVNAETTIEFLQKIKAAYPAAARVHVILDQSGYHRSQLVKNFSENSCIQLHYLPPYSPNLNPIERLWKVMNETIRNNRVFKSAKEFRERIAHFFEVLLPQIAHTLHTRINDNFQILNPVPSG